MGKVFYFFLALVPTNKEAGRAIVLVSKSFFILTSDQR